MAIFIALIFQVLFVFFAMVINIGLIVHDKINLQNSVDLGVYYAAQKQAEILNEIAHLNYQIRQDYKLLAWRYRVLGTLGRIGPSGGQNPNTTFPPARTPYAVPLQNVQWINPGYREDEQVPVVCASHELMSDMLRGGDTLENYCYNHFGSVIPAIPSVVNYGSPVVQALIGASVAATQYAQQQQQISCNSSGVMNWAFAMQMVYAYKHSIAIRKLMIQKLREKLLDPDPIDIHGDRIRIGVEKTIRKNLTESNKENFQFEMINGFRQGNGGCGSPDIAIPEIKTWIRLLFTYAHTTGGGGCAIDQRFQDEIGGFSDAQINVWDPDGILRALSQGEPPTPGDPTHSSLGFEKNPWCMAYMGVKASTRSRKAFAPFGSGVDMQARAFAQPIGGRIGPWYQTGWTPAAERSDSGQKVDVLLTPRVAPGAPVSVTNPVELMPNFSRYPGDNLGLWSQAALGAQRSIFGPLGNSTQPLNDRIRMVYYGFFDAVSKFGDPLPWNPLVPQEAPPAPTLQKLRDAEVSAIAPNLFDAIYYSIDPNYPVAYGPYLKNGPTANLGQLFGRTLLPVTVDLGGRGGHPVLGGFDVADQIRIANTSGTDPGFLANTAASFYIIRRWQHLLTAWAPKALQSFEFPDTRFAKCANDVDPEHVGQGFPAIPGRCSAGGRVGYSVRLVSRDYLLAKNLKLGGTVTAAAGIRNPPDPAW